MKARSSQVVTADEAVRVARAECERLGVPWREPHAVRKGWRSWFVSSPSNRKGGVAKISVSRKTGAAKVRYYDR
jgi:hypothetical protein